MFAKLATLNWSGTSCRLRFRANQKITVLELRCKRIASPVMLPNVPEIWGCFSWASLPPGYEISDSMWDSATPVIDDEMWADRQRRLRSAIEDVAVEKLEL